MTEHRPISPVPAPPLPRRLTSYRVQIAQPIVHTVIVVAPDADAARQAATRLFEAEACICDYRPPAGWDADWDSWSVVGVEELPS